MPVVTLSSDSHPLGREIAVRAATALGYDCVDREILSAVADRHHVPETDLHKALEESPSPFGISSKNHAKYLAYIEEATLAVLLKDRVVCCGLAAHLYVRGISHVLKIRILADPQKLAGEISSGRTPSFEKASALLKRRERFRRRWSLAAYRVDETDPSVYDMVISLTQIDPDEAVRTIVETTGYRKFQPMTYSLKCLKDKALASRVRVALMDQFPDVRVEADGSSVVVQTKALEREKQKKTEVIKKLAGEFPEVAAVEVQILPDIFRKAAESFR
jgi:cytidylate kinase